MMDLPDANKEQMDRICAKMTKLLVKKQALKAIPPQLILNNIMIGNLTNALSRETLRELNVGLIISCVNIDERDCSQQVKYHFVLVKDKPDESISSHFTSVFQVIEEFRKKTDKSILINCFAGKSRSVTLMISYIMKKEGRSFEESFELVKEKIPSAQPNQGFINQLCDYQSDLLARNSEHHDQESEGPQENNNNLTDYFLHDEPESQIVPHSLNDRQTHTQTVAQTQNLLEDSIREEKNLLEDSLHDTSNLLEDSVNEAKNLLQDSVEEHKVQDKNSETQIVDEQNHQEVNLLGESTQEVGDDEREAKMGDLLEEEVYQKLEKSESILEKNQAKKEEGDQNGKDEDKKEEGRKEENESDGNESSVKKEENVEEVESFPSEAKKKKNKKNKKKKR